MDRLLQEVEKISGVKYDISNFAEVTEAIHVIQTEVSDEEDEIATPELSYAELR